MKGQNGIEIALSQSIVRMRPSRQINQPIQSHNRHSNVEMGVIKANNDYSNEQHISVRHSAKVNTLTAALEVVLNDMGVALLPEFLANLYLNQENLVRVLPDFRGRKWHFYFLHQYKEEKPVHVTRFYQLYRHFFHKGVTFY